jgi:hypothetical protein
MLLVNKHTFANMSCSRTHLRVHASTLPPRAKFKRVIYKAKNIYGNIDDAFSVLNLTDTITHTLVHQVTQSKYETTLSLFQNHFWIASKIVILSKMFYLCTNIGKGSMKDNVATYTIILFSVIFITQNFV